MRARALTSRSRRGRVGPRMRPGKLDRSGISRRYHARGTANARCSPAQERAALRVASPSATHRAAENCVMSGPRPCAREALGGLAERREVVHAGEAVERPALDLLGLLWADAQLATDLCAGALLALRAEAQGDHLALLIGESLQRLGHVRREQATVDLLLGR